MAQGQGVQRDRGAWHPSPVGRRQAAAACGIDVNLPLWKVHAIVSAMESSSHANRASGADAQAALAQAEEARQEIAQDLRLPPGYSLLTGLGSVALVYGIALGNSDWRFGPLAFVLGLVIQLTLASVAVRRFRTLNGAWVGGLSGYGSTWPVIVAVLLVLVPCIVAATWLMVAGHPVLSLLVALCALPLTIALDRWWMHRFRHGA